MNIFLNSNQPQVMHIDLNSCFAMIEQQANPLIRCRPVGVAAYDTPGGMILAASYEAKRLGIKIMSVREARLICPDIVVMMPDPAKYRDAHRRFKKILLGYTSEVTPKSVDEFVIDFRGSPVTAQGRSLVDVGHEIKQRIKDSLGEYVTANIGIATNRFLAKTAANLHKPDGLDVITSENLLDVLGGLKLTDLTGINVRYEARLNINGIYTPRQFLETSSDFLKKQVFRSKVGFDWYYRLRGWEVDDAVWDRKSYGHQYALGDKTTDLQELSRLLMKLCEKTGRRLRANNYHASGVHLWLGFANRQFWHKGRDTRSTIFTTQDIFLHAQRLLNQANIPTKVTNMGVSVYNLTPCDPEQLGLFDGTRIDKKSLARAVDSVNDRYGEFSVIPALMANMDDKILDRIAFGSIKE